MTFKQILVIAGCGLSCEITTGINSLLVNIGSGNGLVPSGNRPLPDPMLTQIHVLIWHQLARMS